ncbi:hypothetical protein BJX99DRAFT_206362 [Aspergillus californicus]
MPSNQSGPYRGSLYEQDERERSKLVRPTYDSPANQSGPYRGSLYEQDERQRSELVRPTYDSPANRTGFDERDDDGPGGQRGGYARSYHADTSSQFSGHYTPQSSQCSANGRSEYSRSGADAGSHDYRYTARSQHSSSNWDVRSQHSSSSVDARPQVPKYDAHASRSSGIARSQVSGYSTRSFPAGGFGPDSAGSQQSWSRFGQSARGSDSGYSASRDGSQFSR